ncbi:MAG: tRNA (adenosine(37)-N6)-threonylcarbamoyltransferase complex ATPase subunit type 1 TsaE [Pirellulales bacterium]|nr:tRNA (adenosine(37)-N6)-threonylcarbamoyltransferase complex ATPase subunit type 1 TsaE [Pirellulales bacterium]
MKTLVFKSENESQTTRLGAALSKSLPNGTTVSLCGTLGAGKTRLVQAIAESSGVAPKTVVSPTFVLIQEYEGRRPIYHIDAYRLADEDEFLQLGPEEYFDGEGLTLVEWADRVEICMPRNRIEIHIKVTGETTREFQVIAKGRGFEAVMEELEASLREC